MSDDSDEDGGVVVREKIEDPVALLSGTPGVLVETVNGEPIAVAFGRSRSRARSRADRIRNLEARGKRSVVSKLEAVEDRVEGLLAQVEVVKAASSEWPGALPDRPRVPCGCGTCSCRLHVFPHTGFGVCVWCRGGVHDSGEGRHVLDGSRVVGKLSEVAIACPSCDLGVSLKTWLNGGLCLHCGEEVRAVVEVASFVVGTESGGE